MKVCYPVFIKAHEEIFMVFVPDLRIYTEGDSLADAIYMARDAIGARCTSERGVESNLPEASVCEAARKLAQEDADEFDYSDGILSYVDCDLDEYIRKVYKGSVRKNVTIPAWMAYRAEQEHMNLSKVIQEALREKLE